MRSKPHIITKWEQKDPIYVGTDVVIHCMVLTQDKETKFHWLFSRNASSNNHGVLIDERRYKQPRLSPKDLTISNVKFELKLENLTIDDSGTYICNAENKVGNAQSWIILTVSYPPPTESITSTGTPLFSPQLLVPGADQLEHATPILSLCHGIFTD